MQVNFNQFVTDSFYDKCMGGKKTVFEFPNNYGASIISFDNGAFEIAVLKNKAITYDTIITNDVVVCNDKNEVFKILHSIYELKN